MVLLDRAHTLKVQQIQKEYQDFMERIRSKAQTAIDQANRDYQHRKTIFGAKMNVMVEYLNQQLPMQQLQQQFQRAAQLPVDAAGQGERPGTPRSTAAKEAAFMALLMGQAAQQAEGAAAAGAEAAAPKSGSDGGTQPAPQAAAPAPAAGQPAQQPAAAGQQPAQQGQQQAAAAAQQAAAEAASMQQAVPAAIAGLHTGNLPANANAIVIADRHNMSTMQVSSLAWPGARSVTHLQHHQHCSMQGASAGMLSASHSLQSMPVYVSATSSHTLHYCTLLYITVLFQQRASLKKAKALLRRNAS
jgi:hypothetical protein